MSGETAVKNRTWLAKLSRNKLWNAAALIVSSAVLCTASLMLAIGQAYTTMFFGYFQNPLIFLLNYIPFLLLQLLFYGIWGRQYLAYLSSALILITASIGNYYKLYVRGEPFIFSDIGSIEAGVSIASQYELPINTRIIITVAVVILGALLLAVAAKCRPGKGFRLSFVVLVIAAIFPLWNFVYSSDSVYDAANNIVNTEYTLKVYPTTRVYSRGFVYPFIYSIKDSGNVAPDGYDEAEAESLLAQYDDADISEDKKVNLLIFQLESFTDMTRLETEYDFEPAYEYLHLMQEESIHGLVVAKTYAGGTIKSEHAFLTGRDKYADLSEDINSFVRYVGSQGYLTTGSHPNVAKFYNRVNVNKYLGFDEYFFKDSYEELLSTAKSQVQCDDVFLPEVLRRFEEKLEGDTPVFSFNVTYQGHSPYDETQYTTDYVLWDGGDCADSVKYSVNNYLGLVYDTTKTLYSLMEELKTVDEPVVMMFYGDHVPWKEATAYFGVGYGSDVDNPTLLLYTSDYLIWANDAAKEALGNDFCGEGPTVSTNYLMSVLFDELGWDGSAYMQFQRETRETISVIGAEGCYVENGEFCTELSAEGEEKYNEYEIVTYYALHNLE